MATVYWLVGAAALLILEMITVSLTSIWFAGGALVAAIISVFSTSIILEISGFIIVSALLLFITRPIAQKHINAKIEKTNVDALIGKRCRLAEAIDPDKGTGIIKINNVEWTARAADGQITIKKGTEVVIKEISGVKLLVEPIQKDVEEDAKEERFTVIETKPQVVEEQEAEEPVAFEEVTVEAEETIDKESEEEKEND